MKRNYGFTSPELLIVLLILVVMLIIIPAFYLGAAALTVAIANLFGANITYSWGTLILLALGWLMVSIMLKPIINVKEE